jgi:hypothetical protein
MSSCRRLAAEAIRPSSLIQLSRFRSTDAWGAPDCARVLLRDGGPVDEGTIRQYIGKKLIKLALSQGTFEAASAARLRLSVGPNPTAFYALNV